MIWLPISLYYLAISHFAYWMLLYLLLWVSNARSHKHPKKFPYTNIKHNARSLIHCETQLNIRTTNKLTIFLVNKKLHFVSLAPLSHGFYHAFLFVVLSFFLIRLIIFLFLLFAHFKTSNYMKLAIWNNQHTKLQWKRKSTKRF